ncbi:hypothetical protein STEG23_036115, partial [Scotinomys teguina]
NRALFQGRKWVNGLPAWTAGALGAHGQLVQGNKFTVLHNHNLNAESKPFLSALQCDAKDSFSSPSVEKCTFYTKTMILVRVSVDAMKHHDQKLLGEKQNVYESPQLPGPKEVHAMKLLTHAFRYAFHRYIIIAFVLSQRKDAICSLQARKTTPQTWEGLSLNNTGKATNVLIHSVMW